jgi:hypothetical protein
MKVCNWREYNCRRLKTAKALGTTAPITLLGRANEVMLHSTCLKVAHRDMLRCGS